MTRNGRYPIPGGTRVQLDALPGSSARGAGKTVAVYNAGKCVVGLGGKNVSLGDCWRGLVPGASASMDLKPGEGIWGVVEEGSVGELDILIIDA